MRSEHVAWDDALDDLYASATDDAAAGRLPDRLRSLVGGTSAVLWTLDLQRGGIADRMLTNVAPEHLAEYATNFHAHDPWVPRLAAIEPNVVVRGSSVIDDATLARSFYYNEFGHKAGTFHVAGATLHLGDGARTLGMFAIHRVRTQPEFTARELDLLTRLLPHVRRALQVRAHCAQMSQAAADALLQAYPLAAVVLDGHGRVTMANNRAEALDAAQIGFALRRRPDGLVSAGRPAENKALRALLADAVTGGAGGGLRLTLERGTAFALVSPLPAPFSTSGSTWGLALLSVRPFYRSGITTLPGRTRDAFALTDAESAVLARLCDGRSPKQIADDRGVQVSTVRTLLGRAQAKLGVSNLRAAQVVATLLGE